MLRGLLSITPPELPFWSKFSRVSKPLSGSSQSSSPFTLLPKDPVLFSALSRPSGAAFGAGFEGLRCLFSERSCADTWLDKFRALEFDVAKL
jgi:hypothetical protein